MCPMYLLFLVRDIFFKCIFLFITVSLFPLQQNLLSISFRILSPGRILPLKIAKMFLLLSCENKMCLILYRISVECEESFLWVNLICTCPGRVCLECRIKAFPWFCTYSASENTTEVAKCEVSFTPLMNGEIPPQRNENWMCVCVSLACKGSRYCICWFSQWDIRREIHGIILGIVNLWRWTKYPSLKVSEHGLCKLV